MPWQDFSWFYDVSADIFALSLRDFWMLLFPPRLCTGSNLSELWRVASSAQPLCVFVVVCVKQQRFQPGEGDKTRCVISLLSLFPGTLFSRA